MIYFSVWGYARRKKFGTTAQKGISQSCLIQRDFIRSSLHAAFFYVMKYVFWTIFFGTNVQPNSAISNSSGPAIFVPCNRVLL